MENLTMTCGIKKGDIKMENFEEYTTGELKLIQKEIQNIIEKRNNKAKAESWEKVVEAMKEYIKKFGDIVLIETQENPNCTVLRINKSEEGVIYF